MDKLVYSTPQTRMESPEPFPTEPPRKVLVVQTIHPPTDHVRVSSIIQCARRDTPFQVIRWGALDKDYLLGTGDGTDITLEAFLVERRLHFVRATDVFSIRQIPRMAIVESGQGDYA